VFECAEDILCSFPALLKGILCVSHSVNPGDDPEEMRHTSSPCLGILCSASFHPTRKGPSDEMHAREVLLVYQATPPARVMWMLYENVSMYDRHKQNWLDPLLFYAVQQRKLQDPRLIQEPCTPTWCYVSTTSRVMTEGLVLLPRLCLCMSVCARKHVWQSQTNLGRVEREGDTKGGREDRWGSEEEREQKIRVSIVTS
jgi:hypothetical protein